MSQEYKRIQWQQYLVRAKEFFFTSTLVVQFKGSKLQEVAGFGYSQWLFVNNGNNKIHLYYDGKEVDAFDAQVRELLVQKRKKIPEFFSKGKDTIATIEASIHAYQANQVVVNSVEKLYEEFNKQIEILIDYFLYAVEIPYCIGTLLEKDDLVDTHQSLLKECEEFRSQSHYPAFNEVVLAYLFNSISEFISIDEKNMRLLTYQEILHLLTYPETKKVFGRISQEREKGFLYYCKSKDQQFIEDKKFLATLFEEHESVSELKGKVAQKGKIRGRACVVISHDEFSKFQEGDILVTIQSNPSFMPILHKCSGIVADEGGIMSHAAIVSRELGKPCIIGTKIATEVFQDGDHIELDAYAGVVKKIHPPNAK